MVVRIRSRRALELKDIRPDLEARLSGVQRVLASLSDDYERDHAALLEQYRAKEKELKNEVSVIKAMLDAESRRFGERVPEKPVENEDLDDFLLELLQSGPKFKSELKERAVAARRAADGRSVHFTLLNMKRSGRVRELPDGRYALPAKEEAKQKEYV